MARVVRLGSGHATSSSRSRDRGDKGPSYYRRDLGISEDYGARGFEELDVRGDPGGSESDETRGRRQQRVHGDRSRSRSETISPSLLQDLPSNVPKIIVNKPIKRGPESVKGKKKTVDADKETVHSRELEEFYARYFGISEDYADIASREIEEAELAAREVAEWEDLLERMLNEAEDLD